MNPFWWIVWAVAVLVILFVASAVAAAVYEGIRDSLKPKPCERCGHVPGTDAGHWRKPS